MAQPAKAPDRVNDFVIKLANVNGTGSASANTLLMKAIFRMGVPVMGFTHPLHYGLNTNRFKMMTQPKKSKKRALRLMWALPAAALLSVAFAQPVERLAGVVDIRAGREPLQGGALDLQDSPGLAQDVALLQRDERDQLLGREDRVAVDRDSGHPVLPAFDDPIMLDPEGVLRRICATISASWGNRSSSAPASASVCRNASGLATWW